MKFRFFLHRDILLDQRNALYREGGAQGGWMPQTKQARARPDPAPITNLVIAARSAFQLQPPTWTA